MTASVEKKKTDHLKLFEKKMSQKFKGQSLKFKSGKNHSMRMSSRNLDSAHSAARSQHLSTASNKLLNGSS